VRMAAACAASVRAPCAKPGVWFLAFPGVGIANVWSISKCIQRSVFRCNRLSCVGCWWGRDGARGRDEVGIKKNALNIGCNAGRADKCVITIRSINQFVAFTPEACLLVVGLLAYRKKYFPSTD
jgi:hypothetical protein